MPSYNKVIIMGNLTKDPEMRLTQNGTHVANFSLAVNSRYGEKEEVSFFDVVAFGKTAELIETYMKKGNPLLVEGTLRQNRWEDHGSKRSRVEIMASKISFVGSGSKEHGKDVPESSLPGDSDIPY